MKDVVLVVAWEQNAKVPHFAVRPDWAWRGIPRSKRRDEANQRTGEWRE